MFISEVKDIGACENRRRLFFRSDSFVKILRLLTKFGEEAERERQLLSPLYCENSSGCMADAADDVRIGSIWMTFDSNKLPESCLSEIFPELKMYTYKTFSYVTSLSSSCLFVPISRPATLSEYDTIIEIISWRIERIIYTRNEFKLGDLENHDLPFRKPSASDWFPLPYRVRGLQTEKYKFFEGSTRKPLDVYSWIHSSENELFAKPE